MIQLLVLVLLPDGGLDLLPQYQGQPRYLGVAQVVLEDQVDQEDLLDLVHQEDQLVLLHQSFLLDLEVKSDKKYFIR